MNALHEMKCNILINKDCNTHFYFDMGIYKIEPYAIDEENSKLILRALYVASDQSQHNPSITPENPFLNFLN
jgi:hypothetical protein